VDGTTLESCPKADSDISGVEHFGSLIAVLIVGGSIQQCMF